jgi:dienelactone hydrolase
MLDSHRRARRLALVGLVAAATSGLAAAEPTTIPDSELKARRAAVLSRMPHQLLVVLARPALADVAGQGFPQDPDFLYLTGLRQAVGAVLVLDGPAAESRLY